jgi:ATP-dependent DNA ligase
MFLKGKADHGPHIDLTQASSAHARHTYRRPIRRRRWVFEDKYDGFRMVAKIEDGKVTLYSRNGKVISNNYIEIAKALEGVKPTP